MSKPAIGPLLLQRPAHVGQARLTITLTGCHTRRLQQSPCDMGLVGLQSRGRKRGRVLAPTAIIVLRAYQPSGGAVHWLQIAVIDLGSTCGQPEQYLPGIEGHGHHRLGIDLSALKSSVGQLNIDQPVEHTNGPLPSLGYIEQLRVAKHRGHDVAGGLGVRARPAVDQAVAAGDTAIGRSRAVLCAPQPLDACVYDGIATGICLWKADAITIPLLLCGTGKSQFCLEPAQRCFQHGIEFLLAAGEARIIAKRYRSSQRAAG